MIIKKAEYIISAVKTEQYPEPTRPDLAVSGRSNVGKSSLINKFLSRKKLAKTARTPGKTQTINFFNINDEWYLVDLPGYGYAKVSKQTKDQWGKMMNTYFRTRSTLKGVLQLVDIRHPPTEDDRNMVNMLWEAGIPVLIIATKVDKISKGQRPKHLKIIADSLNLEDWKLILPFSIEDGTGFEELHDAVENILWGDVFEDNENQGKEE